MATASVPSGRRAARKASLPQRLGEVPGRADVEPLDVGHAPVQRLRCTASASASSRCERRLCTPALTCRATAASTLALSQGFSMKSQTPSRMVATASGTVDQAVITMIGTCGSAARTRETSSRPPGPSWCRARS